MGHWLWYILVISHPQYPVPLVIIKNFNAFKFVAGVTQRVVDVINQCRYLSSKSGLTLKQLRLSLRDDEAKQRELVRYAVFLLHVHKINNFGRK